MVFSKNILFQTGWLLSTVELRYGDSGVSAEVCTNIGLT